jgi:ribose 5-phosphate isomerase A
MDTSNESLTAAKRAAGYAAADMVEDGMIVGLGTGSTVFYALERLSTRVSEGLQIFGVPTSYQTARRAQEYSIPLTSFDADPMIDLAIDGADQVDPQIRLIKGRGAALTREKCVAAAALRFVVVVDEQKMVHALSGIVPAEVIPFAIRPVMSRLRSLGCIPQLRDGIKKDGPVIVDCKFGKIENPEELEDLLAKIPGLVESGLFCSFTSKTTVIVGNEKKCKIITSAGIFP